MYIKAMGYGITLCKIVKQYKMLKEGEFDSVRRNGFAHGLLS